MKIHCYFVRHGQTYFNRYNRLQGWGNSPLTEQGIKDAHRAGERLADIQFDAAFCSDTTRAIQTGEVILAENQHSANITLLQNLAFREQFYGYFEGQNVQMSWYAAGAPHGAPTYHDIVKQYGLDATKNFLKEADPFHDAENAEEYWRRVEQGFQIIQQTPTLHDNSNVLVIAHGNTLMSLQARFASEPADSIIHPTNGSINEVYLDSELPVSQAITLGAFNQ